MTPGFDRRMEKDSTPKVPLRTRFKLAAGLLIDSLTRPRQDQIMEILDKEQRRKVVSSALDIDTGVITEVRGDGTPRVVKPSTTKVSQNLDTPPSHQPGQPDAGHEGVGAEAYWLIEPKPGPNTPLRFEPLDKRSSGDP